MCCFLSDEPVGTWLGSPSRDCNTGHSTITWFAAVRVCSIAPSMDPTNLRTWSTKNWLHFSTCACRPCARRAERAPARGRALEARRRRLTMRRAELAKRNAALRAHAVNHAQTDFWAGTGLGPRRATSEIRTPPRDFLLVFSGTRRCKAGAGLGPLARDIGNPEPPGVFCSSSQRPGGRPFPYGASKVLNILTFPYVDLNLNPRTHSKHDPLRIGIFYTGLAPT